MATVSVQDNLHQPIGGLSTSNFSLYEDGVAEVINVTPIGDAGAKADVVFVFDDTGSMEGEIEALKANVDNFVSQLASSSIDYALGLVSFKDDSISSLIKIFFMFSFLLF